MDDERGRARSLQRSHQRSLQPGSARGYPSQEDSSARGYPLARKKPRPGDDYGALVSCIMVRLPALGKAFHIEELWRPRQNSSNRD